VGRLKKERRPAACSLRRRESALPKILEKEKEGDKGRREEKTDDRVRAIVPKEKSKKRPRGAHRRRGKRKKGKIIIVAIILFPEKGETRLDTLGVQEGRKRGKGGIRSLGEGADEKHEIKTTVK